MMLAPAPRQRESHMVQARHSALVDLGDTRRVPLLLGLAVGMLLTVSVMSWLLHEALSTLLGQLAELPLPPPTPPLLHSLL
jgi:hypothetical protein